MDDVAEVVMVPDDRAAELAGVSRRRLRYWEKTGLIVPSVERRISPRNVVRLYSFPQLVELVVVAELRHQGVSLQHVRRIVEHLRGRGYDTPLRELRFALSGDRVLFQHPDGGWEESGRPFQGVISQVIDLEEIRVRIRERLEQRPPAAVGEVERKRKVHASQPVFRGTRIPVRAVRAFLDAGRSTQEILEAFPRLTERDIERARAETATSAN